MCILVTMKVIFGKHAALALTEKITLLELDTFFQPGMNEPITAYAVLDTTDIPIQEMLHMEKTIELHNTMMQEYRQQNWNYCEQALEHLLGKWGGNIDSFYQEITNRIVTLKKTNLPADWTGIVISNPA